jgi:flagellar biosynthesis protein FlhF
MVEVTAAVDRVAGGDRADRPPAPVPPSFSDQMVAASLIQPLREDLTRIKEEVRSLSEIAGRSAPAATTPFVPSPPDSHAVLVEGLPESLVMTYDRLVERGLEHEAVVSFVRSLQNTVPRSDLRRPEKLRACLHRLVARQVRTSGPLLEPLGPPKAVMVVGPTGVGKTTTIAKLAAHYAVKHKRKVALITLDTYRVAAVEQLRIYGQILGLGVDVALTSKDLGWFLDKRKQADLILIDTAGRSPLDETALHDLKKAVPPGRPVEVHLVLSASTREADLEAIAAKYAALPVHRLIFSKLDETDHFGSIFNLMKGSNLPLSYLSTGQCVPVDLELATPDLVADLLLDGRPALVTGSPGTNTRKES